VAIITDTNASLFIVELTDELIVSDSTIVPSLSLTAVSISSLCSRLKSTVLNVTCVLSWTFCCCTDATPVAFVITGIISFSISCCEYSLSNVNVVVVPPTNSRLKLSILCPVALNAAIPTNPAIITTAEQIKQYFLIPSTLNLFLCTVLPYHLASLIPKL